MASDMCESSVTSKSHGRVCKLIDLVLSSSIDDTVRLFTESVVLAWTLFSTVRHTPVSGGVLTLLKLVIKILVSLCFPDSLGEVLKI